MPGIGPKTLRLAYEKLKIRTKEDFLRAVRSGMLATLPGIREKKLQQIVRGLELYEKSKERMSLIEAYQLGELLLNHMKTLSNLYQNIELAGSLRRRKETVGDIDLLVSAKRESWKALHEHFTKFEEVQEVLLQRETKSSVILRRGLKLSEYGVFRADTEEWIGGRTEEDPPELRENIGEVELAMERKLPRLVEWEDIKGEFHIHTKHLLQ
ncbi:helix-hairpin-helix domain-containing protein [Thermocrinis sp.]|uniref:helix-hairpin-helix domain-containing protein n=1 Tax=Thermocrinis sp. TaxID=2024383 RepID=UPI002FDE6A9E